MSVISNFSVIPIRWFLTVDSEMISFLFRSLAEDFLASFKTLSIQGKLIA